MKVALAAKKDAPEATGRHQAGMGQVLRLIRSGERFMIACHRRPDADALGSALGFAAILRALGKETKVFVPDELPLNLRFLACGDIKREIGADERYDAVFVMDTAATELLPDGLPNEDVRGPLVIVDHHASHDDVGDVVVRDIKACATAEVVMDIAESLDVLPVPKEAATPLYAAIVADTGGFRYPSTRSRVLRMGADLIDQGADPWNVAYELFEGWPQERVRLLGEVLDSLQLFFDGRYAQLIVTREMLERVGATDEMIEGMVNYGRMLRGVEAAALLWEFEGKTGIEARLSLRSRDDIDVGKVAASLGGGGHRSAAGATIREPIAAAAERVRDAFASDVFG